MSTRTFDKPGLAEKRSSSETVGTTTVGSRLGGHAEHSVTAVAAAEEDVTEVAVPLMASSSVLRGAGGSMIKALLRWTSKPTMSTVVLLTAVVTLLFADHGLFGPNLSAIAEDFSLSDEEKYKYLGGYIAFAFYGLGAPASLAGGWLADRVDRRLLFVTMATVGQLGALGTAFSRNYPQLLVSRAVTGVAIGGGMPLLYSIVGDLVGPSERTGVAGVIAMSSSLGSTTGQGIAGFLGGSTSLGWRFPFLLVSIPGLLLNCLILVATRDPPRGRAEEGLQEHFSAGGRYDKRPGWQNLRVLVTTPTAVIVMVQGIPGCIPAAVTFIYVIDFFNKTRGLSMDDATTVVVSHGCFAILGRYAGSKIGQVLYNMRRSLQPIFIAVTLLLAVIPFIAMIRYTGGIVWVYVLLGNLSGLLVGVAGPNIVSILMNVTLPQVRGTAFGVLNIGDDLGKGLGPAVVSIFIAYWGVEDAFCLAYGFLVICALLSSSLAVTFAQDERMVQQHLRDYAQAEELGKDQEMPGTRLLMSPKDELDVQVPRTDSSISEAGLLGFSGGEASDRESRIHFDSGI